MALIILSKESWKEDLWEKPSCIPAEVSWLVLRVAGTRGPPLPRLLELRERSQPEYITVMMELNDGQKVISK
jgi:hypothetical protein